MGIGGLTCDNLVGARIVTADGSIMEASDDPDLLWALRGGGGNFGVVTRFDLALHAIGPMYGGAVAVPLGDGAAIRRFAGLMREAPDELLPMLVIGRDTDGNPLLQVQLAYLGDAATGERFARTILGEGWAGGHDLRACSYLDIQSINPIEPFGSRHYWSSSFVTDLSDDLIDVLVQAAPTIPTTASGVLIEPVHGAARRRDTDFAAYSNRSARAHVSFIGTWHDATFDESGTAWSRGWTARIRAWSSGGLYVNYAMPGEAVSASPQDRVRAAYPPDVFERLQVVKRRYDPENLFRGNLNIPPAPQSA